MLSSRPLPRRAVLASGAGLAAIALSGCAIDVPWTDTTVTPPSLGEANPDVLLAAQARAALRGMGLRIDASALADQAGWRALSQLHGRHAGALAGVAPSAAAPTDPAHINPARRAQLLTEEAALHQQLISMAQKSASGGFARLLASMAAATAQRLKDVA